MASIRNLKKDLNYLAYELLTETFAYKHFHAEMDEKKFDAVIRDLVKFRNDILGQINNPPAFESPVEQRQHYRKIHEDMVKMVQVIEQLD